MPRTLSSACSPEYSPATASNTGCGTRYAAEVLAGAGCDAACGARVNTQASKIPMGTRRGWLIWSAPSRGWNEAGPSPAQSGQGKLQHRAPRGAKENRRRPVETPRAQSRRIERRMERPRGLEPPPTAWQAVVLPLYYGRSASPCLAYSTRTKKRQGLRSAHERREGAPLPSGGSRTIRERPRVS